MNTQLAKEILRRGEIDQAMRNKFIADGSTWDESVDIDNTNFMKKVIEKHGWPKISYIGKKASDTAWLLVQHSDHDIKFQKLVLSLMKDLPGNEVNKSNIAYLVDRVLVAENKPQLYGTQFHSIGDKLVPKPIKNKINLDKRRERMGLSRFADYEELMIKKYGND